jgi:ribosomal protein S18 acetylase RimI-like enzyme
VHSTYELTIRVAEPHDGEALAKVFIDAWRGAYRGIVDDAIIDALQHGDVTSWMRNLIANAAARTLLAETAPGDIVGFVRFGDEAEEATNGHLFALYVSSGASGKGVGRQLLERAIGELDPLGTRPISLWVFERNERARRLYEAAGFRPDGATRVEDLYQAPEIRMRRNSKGYLETKGAAPSLSTRS